MNVPYVENEAIWRAADDFRTSAELAGNDMPPIDVLYIMHEDYLRDIRFADFDQFKRWIRDHRRTNRVEDQADEFAGRFLVPPDILRAEYDQFRQRMAAVDPSWHEIEGMRTHVAKHIAPRFGVNHQVIETRFAHERIWPLE